MGQERTKKARVDSQTLFEMLFAFSPDAILVIDSEGRIRECNVQVERLFGYKCSELLGHPVEILIPERFRRNHPAHRTEYGKQPRMRPMGAGLELYGRRKDGTEFPVDIMLSPVETSVGRIVLSVVRDITEQSQREEALRQSQAMFAQLFESSPDAILETDPDGRIMRVNEQVEQMFGYSRNELIGNFINILVPDRFRAAHAKHQREYLAAPRIRSMGAGLELYGKRKDGGEFPVDIMLGPIETPQGIAVLSVIRDIGEKRRAEEAVRKSERNLRTVLENVRDYAILLLDAEGCISTWSSGAERINGYAADEVIGRHFSCLYPTEDIERKKPQEALQRAAALGRHEDEGWRVRKDGSRYWANAVLTAIRDDHGPILGFSKITRDFTERKKSEDAVLLELSRALLSNLEIQEMLSAFSAGIQQVVPHDYAAVALHNPETGAMRIQALNAKQTPRPGETTLPMRSSVAGQVFLSGKPLLLHSFGDTNFGREALRHLTAEGLKSGCWLPLINQDRTLGTLIVASKKGGRFDHQDLRLLAHMASQIAIAFGSTLAFRQVEELSQRLIREKQYLEEEVNIQHNFEEIIGESDALKRVLGQVETVSGTDATALILGETGTGKELIARAIHQLSPRRTRTLIKLNCAAIPAGLLESELFGHEKGAFTGAITQKLGRLELAHNGTLFLDEVGDIPLDLQPKLLRALQEREFERLGSTRTISVDVRLIAATNRDLGKVVADKQFRSDLYYRLKVFPIVVPSLRERREDIPLLVRYFVGKYARRMGKHIESIPPDVLQALTRWHWPGNIRELENFIERSVILAKGQTLRIPLAELKAADAIVSDDTTLKGAEKEHILSILRQCKGMIGGPSGAAARLGLKRTTLNSKLKILGIRREDYI
jgi:formate hydrogenlyase transcriptional activator